MAKLETTQIPTKKMDYFFSFHIQIIIQALALMLIFSIWKIIARTRSKNKIRTAPEPSGALPIIGHLHLLTAKEPVCKILGKIADKYGPIYCVRFGIHRLLVVTGWEAVRDCFTENDRILANRASIIAGKHIGYNNAVFSLAPYGQYWRELRKLATLQLFSAQRIEMLKHVRLSEVESFINNLHSFTLIHKDRPAKVTLSTLLESLTFNISLRMIVGKRYSSNIYEEESSEAWRYKKAIEDAIQLTGKFVSADAIPWLEWLDIEGHIDAMKRTSKELDAIIEKWLQEHLQNRADGKSNGESDFMDVLISNLAEGSVISGYSRDVIIKATTMILTLTGAGSTSIALTWIVSLLLNHPKVLRAAQEELDDKVGKQRWVEESDIQNLKYLQAVVKETFRLYPPGPITGIREANEDIYISGYYVPKGTRVVIDIWKLHRDPRVWKNPDEFEPERFLTSHAEVDFRGQNFEYLPFGSGRRSCPAINLGIQVVQLVLARLLQGFDLTTPLGLPVDMKEGLGLALPKLKPLEVEIKPRLASGLYQCL